MGDASPANERSSSENSIQKIRLLERGESSASAQARPWTPIPTAFDIFTPVTMEIVEEETPSRPVTPSQDLTEDADSRADGGGMNLEAAIPSERTIERLQAKSKSAACKVDATADNPSKQLKDYNSRWSRLFQALVSTGRIANRTATPHAPANVCILCHAILDSHSAADAHEHRLICIRNWKKVPAPCPRCRTFLAADGVSQSVARKAEHLYNCSIHPRAEVFQTVQGKWLERQNQRKDTGNCPFCLHSLREQNMVDALFHRMKCLDRKQPTRCPICFKELRQLPALSMLKGGFLLHVRECQHGGELPPFDEFYQSRVFDRLSARTRLLCALLDKHTIGPRKSWGPREHGYSFRMKRDAGRRNTSGLYLTPCTKLRAYATYDEDEGIKLADKTRSFREVWNNLERFRRSAFCVYKVPKEGMTVEGYRSGKGICRTVHTCCPERSSPASDGAKGTLTCEDMRLAAAETARRTGIRIPPGFEPDSSKSQRGLQDVSGFGDCPSAQDKHVGDAIEQRVDPVPEP